MPPAPPPPTGLLKAAKDRWQAFWSSPSADKVDLNADLPRLVRWIQQSDEYDRAAKKVRGAHLVRGSMGQPVANPLIGYLATLDVQLARAETEFGMTPAARQRLDIGLADDPGGRKPEGDKIDELRARRAARRRPAG